MLCLPTAYSVFKKSQNSVYCER